MNILVMYVGEHAWRPLERLRLLEILLEPPHVVQQADLARAASSYLAYKKCFTNFFLVVNGPLKVLNVKKEDFI